MSTVHLRGRATAADVNVGRMVKVLLDLAGMTKGDLATAAGVSPQALSDKFSGRSPWSLGEMDRVAAALGVTRATLQRDPDALLVELASGGQSPSTGGKTDRPNRRWLRQPVAMAA